MDLDRVIDGAKERGCFFEINAHPTGSIWTTSTQGKAKEADVKLAISTGAHSTVGLSAMRYGVNQARRGWITAPDVLNTRSWSELRKLFAR